MPTVDVKDLAAKKVGTLELDAAVFAAPVKESLLHAAVRNYLAGLRRGTHQTKTRGDVSGGGRKPWRQKGTGRARHGSIRSPIWRHGGTIHGPQPRDYSYAIPRKMLLGALRSALTAKLEAEQMLVVEALALESHKTRELRAALDALGVEKTLLIVETGENTVLERASRNLAGVTLLRTHEVHPYHLLAHERVLFSRAAVEKLQSALRPKVKAA